MPRIVKISLPTGQYGAATVAPGCIGRLPNETSIYTAALISSKKRATAPVVDGRVDKKDDANSTQRITADLWSKMMLPGAEEMSARLRHMQESMPLARPDVASWYYTEADGKFMFIQSDDVPGLSLMQTPLLITMGASTAVDDLLQGETAKLLTYSVMHDLWLDSFNVYAPPLFCLISSALPGIKRPIPAVVNTTYLAVYYLAYIKALCDIGYSEELERGVGKNTPAEQDAASKQRASGVIKSSADALRVARNSISKLRKQRRHMLAGALASAKDLAGACDIHRRATFAQLRILEAEITTLLRLPGAVTALLAAYATHTDPPTIDEEEVETASVSKHNAIAATLFVFDELNNIATVAELDAPHSLTQLFCTLARTWAAADLAHSQASRSATGQAPATQDPPPTGQAPATQNPPPTEDAPAYATWREVLALPSTGNVCDAEPVQADEIDQDVNDIRETLGALKMYGDDDTPASPEASTPASPEANAPASPEAESATKKERRDPIKFVKKMPVRSTVPTVQRK